LKRKDERKTIGGDRNDLFREQINLPKRGMRPKDWTRNPFLLHKKKMWVRNPGIRTVHIKQKKDV